MASPKKLTIFEEINAFLKKYPNLAILKFDKTNHSTLEQLRKILIKNDARLKVVKNSLFQKLLNTLVTKDKNLKTFYNKAKTSLKENSALLGLTEDWSKGLNSFATFSEKEKSLSFKLGFLDQVIYDATQMTTISKLPPKEQLIGKVIGSLNAPISKFTYSIKFNVNKLVYVLKAKGVKN